MPPARARRRSKKKARKTTKRSSLVADLIQKTPPSKASASATAEALEDKIEYSPNALARCCHCRGKIKKGEQRYGITEFSERYNKEIYRYFHQRCCPSALKARVPFAEDALNRQRKEERSRARLLRERDALYQNLKTLRQIFARRLGYSPFIVLQDSTLEDLVVKMPTSKPALLNVHGIGTKKCQSFGDPIIRLIFQYKRQVASVERETVRSSKSRTVTNKKSGSSKADAVALESDNEDDDCLEVGETLTCEQLVNQKFQHAAANGYVISVD